MRTVQREIVSALIFSRDGKLFQGMKEKGGVYDDCWHIPGGGVEEGESLHDALVREVWEETGIDITPYDRELVDDVGTGESEKTLKETGERVLVKMYFTIYKVIIADKTAEEISVALNDDLVAYQWTNRDDLSLIKMTPPSVDLFKRLGYLGQ